MNLDCHGKSDNIAKYKQIRIPSESELNAVTRQLVPEQMNILREVITACKDIVKSRRNIQMKPKSVRLLVHGGAGVGKSKTINAISKHAEKVLRQSGTNQTHPTVILCAFTAKAAKLIGEEKVKQAEKDWSTLKDYVAINPKEGTKGEYCKAFKQQSISQIVTGERIVRQKFRLLTVFSSF